LSLVLHASDVDALMSGNWASRDRPVRAPAGVRIRETCDKPR